MHLPNDRIILMDKGTHESIYFNSKRKASQFLGRNDAYLSNRINKGQYDLGNYWIFVSPGEIKKIEGVG